jgi:hypothetical protein
VKKRVVIYKECWRAIVNLHTLNQQSFFATSSGQSITWRALPQNKQHNNGFLLCSEIYTNSRKLNEKCYT